MTLFVVSLGMLASYRPWADAQADAGVEVSDRAPIRSLRGRQIHPRRFTLRGHDYLAVGATDFDGDGKSEIVLVRAGALGIVRLPERGSRVEVLASRALAPVAAPLLGRRPFALVEGMPAAAYIRIGSRSMALEARLAGDQITLRELPPRCGARAFDVGDACALLVQGRDYFASQLGALPDAEGVATTPTPAASSFYTRRHRLFVRPDETRVGVEVLVNPSGRLVTTLGSRSASLLGVGAALALGDLEGDGEPELLTSVATGPDRPERLLVYRLRLRDGRITRLYRSAPLEGRVMIAGAGDLDGDGDDELFAIEEPSEDGPAHLWVLP